MDRAWDHHDGNGSLDFHTGDKSQIRIRKWPLRQLPDLPEQSQPRAEGLVFGRWHRFHPLRQRRWPLLQTGSTHRHKIMSDDAPANVSFKSNLTLIKDSLHAKAVFERARAAEKGGKPQACGWIVDKYGVRWQIVPTVLVDMMSDPDKTKAGRVAAEMLRQVKFDIAKLKKAFDGR